MLGVRRFNGSRIHCCSDILNKRQRTTVKVVTRINGQMLEHRDNPKISNRLLLRREIMAKNNSFASSYLNSMQSSLLENRRLMLLYIIISCINNFFFIYFWLMPPNFHEHAFVLFNLKVILFFIIQDSKV